jgi:serine/threonine-protein kinase
MAEIFLARARTELGGQRRVVVKQILPGLTSMPQFAEMLIHEAKLAALLDHANVAQVYDLGRADDRLFIAMEYVEGFDLNDLLRRCTKQKVPVPIELALAILCDTLRGLDYAHRRTAADGTPLGIVHRDVSPSNVLVSFDGQVKVCDFGIAHANDLVEVDGETRVSPAPTAEALKGKAGYMSPEHARGLPVDARADVFGVGILLWEMLSGRRMYRHVDGGPTLLEQARAAEFQPIAEKGVPREEVLHAIAKKALSPAKEDRYPSAAAMLREIEAYLAEAQVVVSPIRLGDWLVASFGSDIVIERRKRQRAAEALEMGPPVLLTPIAFQPTPTPVVPNVTARLPALTAIGDDLAKLLEQPAIGPRKAPEPPAPPPPSSMALPEPVAFEIPPFRRESPRALVMSAAFAAVLLLVASSYLLLHR